MLSSDFSTAGFFGSLLAFAVNTKNPLHFLCLFFKLFCAIILNHLKCLFNIYSTVYIENVKFIFKTTLFVSECFSLPLQPSLLVSVYISGMGIF